MATIKICDKCQKEISIDKPHSYWEGNREYILENTKKGDVEIDGQEVVVDVKIRKVCGESLDLCNNCGYRIIKNKLPRIKKE